LSYINVLGVRFSLNTLILLLKILMLFQSRIVLEKDLLCCLSRSQDVLIFRTIFVTLELV